MEWAHTKKKCEYLWWVEGCVVRVRACDMNFGGELRVILISLFKDALTTSVPTSGVLASIAARCAAVVCAAFVYDRFVRERVESVSWIVPIMCVYFAVHSIAVVLRRRAQPAA